MPFLTSTSFLLISAPRNQKHQLASGLGEGHRDEEVNHISSFLKTGNCHLLTLAWREVRSLIFLKNVYLFIFLAALGLRCRLQTFSSCNPLASHFSGLSCCRAWATEHTGFCSCGAQAWLACDMWNLPQPGLNPCPLPWQVDSGQPDKSKKSYLSTTTESLDGYLKMGNSNYRTEIVFCKHECNKVS